MDFDTRPASYAVIVRDEEVLLTHYRTPSAQGWTLPGGGVELHESPQECCRREVLEETGYHVEVGALVGVGHVWIPAATREFPNGDRALLGLQIIYRAQIVSGELECEVDGSTDDVRWVPLAQLDDYRGPGGWPVTAIRSALASAAD